MKLEQGKKYTCIKQPSTNFTVGKDYLAITNYQLLDNNACPVDIRGWGIDGFFLKARAMEQEKKLNELLKEAKSRLEEKLSSVICDFEKETGMVVNHIHIHRTEMPITNCPELGNYPPFITFGVNVDLSYS